MSDRLEKLKAEKEIIQNMKCLSFELRDKCIEWYDHEIECIERDGGVKKMSRYINADKEYLEPFFYEHLTDYEMIAAQNAIDEVPTADVEPVRHGKWLRNACMDDIYYSHYKCSECEREIEIPHSDTEKLTIKYPYCNCGAKMDG